MYGRKFDVHSEDKLDRRMRGWFN